MTEKKRAIALGFFDGVHLGHGELLKKTVERASQMQGIPSVLSFDVHPDTLVFKKDVPLINSAKERQEIIRRIYGIEDFVLLHFDEKIMRKPWREFIEEFVAELNVGWIIAGHDFCFGYKGEGTADRLKAYCEEHRIGCDIIPALSVDGVVASSSYIRELIADGDMERASRFLGHPHTLSDTIQSGFHLGRKMGTPTINMTFAKGVLIPRYGVYAARVYLEDGMIYPAVTNIGIRPTVDNSKRENVESHLLHFSGDLYGQTARLEFLHFMRPEIRFASLEELGAQIRSDAQTAERFFEQYNF